MTKNIVKLVKKAGLASAKHAVNSASAIYAYQPKQPANAKEICNK